MRILFLSVFVFLFFASQCESHSQPFGSDNNDYTIIDPLSPEAIAISQFAVSQYAALLRTTVYYVALLDARKHENNSGTTYYFEVKVFKSDTDAIGLLTATVFKDLSTGIMKLKAMMLHPIFGRS